MIAGARFLGKFLAAACAETRPARTKACVNEWRTNGKRPSRAKVGQVGLRRKQSRQNENVCKMNGGSRHGRHGVKSPRLVCAQKCFRRDENVYETSGYIGDGHMGVKGAQLGLHRKKPSKANERTIEEK